MNARDRALILREARADDGYVDRLVQRYGSERAAAILEGRDPATEADLAAWRALGQTKRADTICSRSGTLIHRQSPVDGAQHGKMASKQDSVEP